MPRNTSGPTVKERVKRLLEALLAFVNGEFEDSFDIKSKWEAEDSNNPKLIVETTLVTLEWLIAKDKYPGKLTKPQIREALNRLKDFLKILEDNRTQTKGVDTWHFTLTLWSKDQEKNLKQFDKAWEDSRPEKSKALEANFKKSDAFDWRNICLAMLEAEKPLTTNALMPDEDDRFELEEIHVPLALVERKKPDRRGEEILPEQGSRLYEPEYEEKQRFEHEQFLLDILKDGKGKHKGKRIAIIGEPGAGKTTLLRKIAFWVQENTEILPISISLADLPETNSKQEFLEQYLLDKWLKAALPYISLEMVEVTEALKTELKKLCNQGRVWLLLDGVDEMPVQGEERLWAISNQLKGWVGQARVVLTCRLNVWEANRNVLADNFEIYRTLEFSYGDSTTPDRVGEFIAKWFNKTPILGQQLRQALDEPGKERIKDLVKNPLRLALLCSTWNLWRDRDGLPDTKAKLYQGFVEKFYDWKGKEFPTNYTQREKLNRALRELAKLAIDKTESRFRLKHSLVCQVLGQPDEELFGLALKLGWLNKVGLAAESPDETVYAFWHPTFEEYFAALAVDNWDFFLNHVPENPKQGIYRIFEKQWKEVILLWLGRGEIEAKQKEEFIDALVDFEDGCGEWSYQDVDKGFYEFRASFLAAVAIAEFQDYSQIDEVVGQIVRWGFGNGYSVISNAAREALEQTQLPKAIDALVQLLDSPNLDNYTSRKVAESLGNIGQGNQNAIDALVQLLDSGNLEDSTRWQVAESLGKIGQGNQNAIDALVQLLNSPDLDYFTRWQVAEILGKIDPGNQNAIAALVPLLNSPHHNDYARRGVAESLGKIGQGNQNAIAALEELLTSSNYIRREVAESLGKIDPGNQNAIAALEKQLNSLHLDDYTRWLVAESLGEIDRGNQTAIDALVQLLNSLHRNDLTFLRVIQSLGKIGQDNQTAIDALVQLLISPDLEDSTRWQVADSLGKIGQGNQNAIDALVKLLNSPHLDDFTRWQVVSSLGKIDPGNQKAINALVQLLNFPHLDDYIRRQVAEILGQIGQGNQNAIAALVQLLNSPHHNDYARRKVTEILGQIGQGNQNAIHALVQLLNSGNLDDDTRWQAASNLGKIDPGNQNAIDALVQLLNSGNLNYDTRRLVVGSLGKIGQGNQKAIDALVQLLSSPNLARGTRWQVAETLEKMKLDTDKQCAVITALTANFKNPQKIDLNYYALIWRSAQNLPYPDFYQAWHQDTLTNSATASLNVIAQLGEKREP